MLILGIESSCDETAASVVRDGVEVLSNVIASQIQTHQPYGGVVPELASREHLEKIRLVVEQSLDEAGLTANEIDGIAVTNGPGLIGSLLVGINYAKGLAFALRKPLWASITLKGTSIPWPSNTRHRRTLRSHSLSLADTRIFFLLPQAESYKLIGRTRDDAAGEAFDKVSKLLGLGYPGGPIIDRLSTQGNKRAIIFSSGADQRRGTPAGLLI
jgi:N6-L-threonylcarbamoyladenine synthase